MRESALPCFYNKRMQMGVAELGTASNHAADSCREYSYYVGTNASACAESPSGWPTGTNNNGNVAGYFYSDTMNDLCHTASYTFDGENRLVTAAATGCIGYSQAFTYDAYGNLYCSPSGPGCVGFTYNATNQIAGYQYDLAGNVTNDGTFGYQWDAEGRLLTVTQNSQAVATNVYNALGQRVRDVTQNGTTDEAYGAGGNLLWRYTGDSDTRSFVPFNGGILAEYYSGGTLFDHPDQLGSITASTSYNGSACQERLFYPFGELWTGAGSCGMHQTFAQLPDYDAETDQYNTLARHYTPSGRWMSPDPANAGAHPDDPQTWNAYAYVRNNPTTLTDPSGLDFYLACQDASETCGHVAGYDGLVVGTTSSNGKNGDLVFTATVVTQENGHLQDQYGMTYGGYFDQSGVHLTSADGTVSGNGQFVQGTKETDLFGQGLYFGVEGKFVSACGGSCKARSSISDLIPMSVKRVEGALNQREGSSNFLDRFFTGAHDAGPQWMDSTGLDHVIAIQDPKNNNNGKTELHFEGHAVNGFAIRHAVDAIGDRFSGRADAERQVILP